MQIPVFVDRLLEKTKNISNKLTFLDFEFKTPIEPF